jgi:CheY-like chemotaxis protein
MPKKRILFIDDEFLLREVIYELLTDMGYEVEVEKNGAEAIRTFAKRPGDFDLVLTDLMMLDMMGDEIAERILAIRPDLPVIIMTGTPQSFPSDKARAMGVCKVLGKPLTKTELYDGIRGALSHNC